MGYMTAIEYAACTDLGLGLAAHFQSNCYPPIPAACIGPARDAIAAVVNGDPAEIIDLDGIAEHRLYGTRVPAWVLIEGWRLEAFVDYLMGDGFDEDDYIHDPEGDN